MSFTASQSIPRVSDSTDPSAEAALILGGGLKSSLLSQRLGRPLLCLPYDSERTLIQAWTDAFAGAGIHPDSVAVLTDAAGKAKWDLADNTPNLVIDRGEYRGPAGVLRDASISLGFEGPRLVVEHSRLLAAPESLRAALHSHESGTPSITVVTNPDASFSGILIADAEAIEIVPPIGFMDIKEQWIPAAQSAGCRVRRVSLGDWCYSIRSLPAYLSTVERIGSFKRPVGMRVIGRDDRGGGPTDYGGSLVHQSARLGTGVAIARSVICGGAEIGDGAVVVRSVVGPGARVPKEGVVVDSILPAADEEQL